MDVIAAITGRRTVRDFTSEPVSQEQVEAMLAAAIRAPNHRLTNPWEFYVMTGEAKEHLARLRGELAAAKSGDPDSPQATKSYTRAHGQLATVPCAILVCQRLSDDPVHQEEDPLAVACAIQNLMLAAYSMGFGTFWSTGPVMNHPETFRVLGVPEGQRGIGLVFVGRPVNEQTLPKRDPVAAHVRWVDKGPTPGSGVS